MSNTILNLTAVEAQVFAALVSSPGSPLTTAQLAARMGRSRSTPPIKAAAARLVSLGLAQAVGAAFMATPNGAQLQAAQRVSEAARQLRTELTALMLRCSEAGVDFRTLVAEVVTANAIAVAMQDPPREP